MVIKAITPPLVRNNQVNFTSGKVGHDKRTGSNNGYSMPDCKAVPLAVLIAMSPLNASAVQNTPVNKEHNIELVSGLETAKTEETQQNGKVISSKQFKISSPLSPFEHLYAPRGYDVSVDVVKKNDGTTGVDLKIDDQKANDVCLTVVDFALQSDNGTSRNYLTGYVYCTLEDGNSAYYVFGNNSLVAHMAQLKEEYPDAIQTKRVEAVNGVSEEGVVFPPQGNIMKDAPAYKPKGNLQKIVRVDSDNGTCFTRYYSSDNNPDNIEIVTYRQSASSPEFKVKEVVVHTDYLRKDSYMTTEDNTSRFMYNEVVVSDANGKDYRIVDTKLAQNLVTLMEAQNRKGEPLMNNAYTARKAKPVMYELLPEGELVPDK